MSSDATDNTMRAELLPPPDRTYCDHSYPAYSPALVEKIVAEAVAAEREAVNEKLRLFAVNAKGIEAKAMALAIFHAMKGRAFYASQHSKPDREPSEG